MSTITKTLAVLSLLAAATTALVFLYAKPAGQPPASEVSVFVPDAFDKTWTPDDQEHVEIVGAMWKSPHIDEETDCARLGYGRTVFLQKVADEMKARITDPDHEEEVDRQVVVWHLAAEILTDRMAEVGC